MSHKNHKPKQEQKETNHFYLSHKTTSREDYRAWKTKPVVQAGSKQQYRPFNAKFDYSTTYKHDFEKDSKQLAGRYVVPTLELTPPFPLLHFRS